MTCGALGAHDIVTFAPFFDQGRDQRGGILEIRIHENDRVALGELDARGGGRLVPEIPREQDSPNTRVRPVKLLDRFARPVRAAVVDEEDLPRERGRVEGRAELFVQLRQVLSLIKHRADHGHGRPTCFCLHGPLLALVPPSCPV